MNFFVLAKSHVICFADVSSFSVILGNFSLWHHWRYLTPFHNMPKFKPGIIPHVLMHVLTKLGRDWAMFFLFMTSNVNPFFHIFCWPTVGQLIPCCIWSPIFKWLLLLDYSSVSYKCPLARKLWCCSFWIFMF